jgi:3-oxoacyl-(acyl-carrier-protein) synthase
MSSSPQRVLITGVGAATPFGLGFEATWAALVEGRPRFDHRIFTVDRLPPTPPIFSATIAELAAETVLGRRGLRVLSREAAMFLVAAVTALRDAKLAPDAVAPPDRFGVCVGTSRAGLEDYLRFHLDSLIWGPSRVQPAQGPNTGFNAPSSHATIRLRARAANHTVCSGACSSIDAAAAAADLVRRGDADVVIAGGVEAFSYFSAAALGPPRPARPPRPFDRDREGAVPGEGAVALVFESAAFAGARGASALAEVGEAGAAFEPAPITGEACGRAIAEALAGAGPPEVIFASASGDRAADAAEAEAIAAGAGGALVCAIKGCAGEWLGAAGALQIAALARSLHEGLVPPTLGFEAPDPALPALQITRSATRRALRRGLVCSMDPAGHASALALERPA